MLSSEEDVEVHALRRRGWSIAAIARHTGRDRKTIRAYLNGDRQPGARAPAGEDPFDRIAAYVAQRLVDDPHVQATALFDEVVALGYPRAYSTFTRQLRGRSLRPICPACSSFGVATIEIEHPAGEEIQWDWVELPGAPWLDGATAMVLVGALAYSGRFRAVFAERTDQPHTFDAINGVLGRLGGTSRRWRFDRMGTVVEVGTDRILPTFAAFAKHHGAGVDVCPARRAKRKGVVERAIQFLTQRWWRTAAVTTPQDAQASLDVFCETIADDRPRHAVDGTLSTVRTLAGDEHLRRLPVVRFPAVAEVTRTVTTSATVPYRANHYSVDPGLIGAEVIVRHHLHRHVLDVVDPASGLLARHRLCAGHGVIVRDGDHAQLLETAVLEAFTTAKPCRRKANRPPTDAAAALAAELRGEPGPADAVVIDLAAWAANVPEAGR